MNKILTSETKLEIVKLTFDIKRLCDTIENTILKNQGHYCPESGGFPEIDYIFDLATKLQKLHK